VDDETVPPAASAADDSTETSTTGGGGSDEPPTTLSPDVLVSLTAPKRCSRGFRGRSHYVVQRFVPPELLSKYALGTAYVDAAASLCVQLSLVELDTACSHGSAADGDDADQRSDE